MIGTDGADIKPDEIFDFLKRDMRFKETCQQIWYRRIISQAAQARGLTVSDAEVQAEADRFRRERRLERSIDTLAWLADQLVTPEDWEAGIRDRLLAQKLAETMFGQEVDAFFAHHRLDFDKVILYQIVVPYEQLAQELFYEIEESEISFYEAAHLYDIEEARRHLCGYEGTLHRWSLKPDIAAAVFAAEPGKIVHPIRTEQGYHLLMVEAFLPAALTSETHQEILERLFKEWLEGELNHQLHN